MQPPQYYSRKKPVPTPVHIRNPVVTGKNSTISVSNNLTELWGPSTIRKGVRKCTQHPISQFVSCNKIYKQHKAFFIALNAIPIPKNEQEAENENWNKAMREEMDGLIKNETPSSSHIIETQTIIDNYEMISFRVGSLP